MEKYGYDFTEQDIEEAKTSLKEETHLIKEGEDSYTVKGLAEIIEQVE